MTLRQPLRLVVGVHSAFRSGPLSELSGGAFSAVHGRVEGAAQLGELGWSEGRDLLCDQGLGDGDHVVEAQCAGVGHSFVNIEVDLRGILRRVRVDGAMRRALRTGIAAERVRMQPGRRPSGSSYHQTSPRFT